LPQGRVLAPPKIGLVIPAYTHHRVWAGHWFLTPDYWPKVELYPRLISDPARFAELNALLDQDRIDYLVVPTQVVPSLTAVLGPRLTRQHASGELAILELEP
ncbi:MAG: hypothetical protein OES47_12325, partial [Acidobacteriota bacterium]|nr:hypothetical protein [Acidobacteriota bacterium]